MRLVNPAHSVEVKSDNVGMIVSEKKEPGHINISKMAQITAHGE